MSIAHSSEGIKMVHFALWYITRFKVIVLLASFTFSAAVAAQQTQPPSPHDDSDYQIWDRVLIPMKGGGVVSATVVKKKGL